MKTIFLMAVAAVVTWIGCGLFYGASHPAWWSKSVEAKKILILSEGLPLYENQAMTKVVRVLKKGSTCVGFYDETYSFMKVDAKDNTILEQFVLCEGNVSGWIKGI
ncbi:hypothetical protein ACTSKR_06495 [Chitinibacteraceae bacterium HSL-7]